MNIEGEATAPARGRTQVWLPLLRTLTERVPRWYAWKNAESAFEGTGDVDAAAPAPAWGEMESIFCEWARAHSIAPVAVCTHRPESLKLVAIPADEPAVFELDVKDHRIFRGATLFTLEDLDALAVMDPRGFRRIRSGAEALYKLAFNGMGWDGAPHERGLRDKRVREQLAADPDGVVVAAQRLGRAGRPALRLARAAAAGGWDRRAALAFEGMMLASAAADPVVAARRLRFRLVTHERCSVVRVLLGDARRIPADRAAWLDEVRRDHRVVT